jgi:hypothetical protein
MLAGALMRFQGRTGAVGAYWNVLLHGAFGGLWMIAMFVGAPASMALVAGLGLVSFSVALTMPRVLAPADAPAATRTASDSGAAPADRLMKSQPPPIRRLPEDPQ